MSRTHFSRHLFFFVLAVLVPSAVLLVFGARFMGQERQLTISRQLDSRIRFAENYGFKIFERLEDLTESSLRVLDESRGLRPRFPGDSILLWLGTNIGGQFQAPWELNQPVVRENPILADIFQNRIRTGVRLEYGRSDYAGAARIYEQAVENAREREQRIYAQLRLAGTLKKGGRLDEAASLIIDVMETPPSVVDEYGIPLVYYAIDLALDVNVVPESVLSVLRNESSGSSWYVPERTYMLTELLQKAAVVNADLTLEGDLLQPQMARRTEETEAVLRLRIELPGIMRESSSRGSNTWKMYSGLGSIIRAVNHGPGNSEQIFAVRYADLADLAGSSSSSDVAVIGISETIKDEKNDLSLRPFFPELYVQLSSARSNSRANGSFLYVSGLALVIGLALFAGFLFWRDVRRESQLVQLRGQFVSSVSHELRTPLTSIRLYAESMIIDVDIEKNEQQRYLNIIAKESERLTRLLNNVLNASRIEQGTMTYNRRADSLQDSINAAADAIQYQLEQNEIKFEMQIDESIPTMVLDRDAIEQAVLNLLSNAIKYGGSPARIRLQLFRDESDAVVAVSDNGPGIRQRDIKFIFERFYRVSRRENQRIPGAGLGLAIVQHIVEAHDGEIAVTSDLGEGSTFSIRLPINAQA